MIRRALLLLLPLVACGPNPAAPVKVMAVLPTRAGAFQITATELTTLTSLTALKGGAATIVGGARIVIDPNDPLFTATGASMLTDEQISKLVQKDYGQDVRANFIDREGTYWPADFHTWNMTSMYWAFEKAQAYFKTSYAGQSTDALRSPRVLYWAQYIDKNQSEADQVDNAFFNAIVKAFVVVPFKDAQLIPFAMNPGIIGHEFSHFVFNQRVFDGMRIPPPLTSWANANPTLSLLKAIDEGLADFHGHGTTCTLEWGCQPSFLTTSVSNPVVAARDLSSKTACLAQEVRDGLKTFSWPNFVGNGMHYRIGTLFAASLYQASVGRAANPTEAQTLRTELERNMLTALDAPKSLRELFTITNDPSSVTLESIAERLAANIPDLTLRTRVCQEFLDRLMLDCPGAAGQPCSAVLPSCANNPKPVRACTPLPPPTQ